MVQCPLYNDLRHDLYVKLSEVNPDFTNLNDADKFVHIMTNADCGYMLVKAVNNMFRRRRLFV